MENVGAPQSKEDAKPLSVRMGLGIGAAGQMQVHGNRGWISNAEHEAWAAEVFEFSWFHF